MVGGSADMVGGNTDVVGGNADVTWFPRHFKQRGASRQRRHSANPLLRLGRGPQGHRIRQTAGYPARRPDPQQTRLTKTGGTRKVPQTFHWPREHRVNSAGGVRKDGTGANRMTGVVTRDSAQLQPIASIGRTRDILTDTPALAPPPLTAAVPWRTARPSVDFQH